MSEDVPGIDFDRLTPWFRELGDLGDESRSLGATIIGHGNLLYRRLKSAA
jgi:hypothetical protein